MRAVPRLGIPNGYCAFATSPNKLGLKILEGERADDEIARKIFTLRSKAGLTQAQLGKLLGTTASLICRLEDAL